MRIVIVGGVAAGATAAAKLRRSDPSADIVIYDRDSTVSYSACGLPYFIGGEVAKMSELVPRDAQWFTDTYRIEVRANHEVVAIDPEQHTVLATALVSGAEVTDTYDVLILATGAHPIVPDLPGIHAAGAYTLRNPGDAEAVHDHLQSRAVDSAVILGAGYVGLEMAEQLTGLGLRVHVVEQAVHVMPSLDSDVAETVARTLQDHGVTLRLSTRVAAIHGDPVREVRLDSGEVLAAQLVIVAAGVRPTTALADQAGVALGRSGAIAVDRSMATNVPGIYAVGDVAESFDLVTGQPVWRPLGTTANKQGRIAGDAITGGALRHRGVLGTAIFRVFDLDVAMTGLTEKAAEAQGFRVVAQRTSRIDRAQYFGGEEMLIKSVADRATGRLLGAQVIGHHGVDKRIDVLATAITFGARAEDLFHLDLAYAPPYSTTKDPVHYAGMALTRVLGQVGGADRSE